MFGTTGIFRFRRTIYSSRTATALSVRSEPRGIYCTLRIYVDAWRKVPSRQILSFRFPFFIALSLSTRCAPVRSVLLFRFFFRSERPFCVRFARRFPQCRFPRTLASKIVRYFPISWIHRSVADRINWLRKFLECWTIIIFPGWINSLWDNGNDISWRWRSALSIINIKPGNSRNCYLVCTPIYGINDFQTCSCIFVIDERAGARWSAR